ncbi:MAG: hypothetical protein CO012_00475 [Syntrophobacterales bacterium CG_4_8_14_3_um_filter_49_14]|nr:MAG: hypothetical protein CO012_00475 [Syntrophobacterales bacterium CG_4_8_14_3_um_filter_49_14]
MDKKTSGAWIIHHTHKLQGVKLAAPGYEEIGFAGKCGIVLNALAGSAESELTTDRIAALAKANGISVRLELPSILVELKRQRLIDQGDAGIAVLGLTTAQTLEHTAAIFEGASPGPCEKAAIDLAEKVSDLPVVKGAAAEYISDAYHLPNTETSEILQQCEQIGFFDAEEISGQSVYFNGNLFRREDMNKANAVLGSLSSNDERHVVELTERLKASGCIAKSDALAVLGEQLYSKMCSIGFIDENSIGNESGTFSFVTRPAAFSKFTNSAADDAFDLAKAFVTSLTYGMTSSPYGRGRIRMIEALMRKLIGGSWVGPATAIGQDYKVLEMKGVVEVRSAGDGRFSMRLLKREVGQLALTVITEGEAGGTSLLEMPGVSATRHEGPEANRSVIRKKQAEPLKRGVARLLSDLRTGGLR